MNGFNTLLKELFVIEEPKQPPKRKKTPAPTKPPVEKAEVIVKEEPQKTAEDNKAVKERTVAGVPINTTTLRQSVVLSEIIGKPLCKRK